MHLGRENSNVAGIILYYFLCPIEPLTRNESLANTKIVCVCNSDVGNLIISLHAPQTRGPVDCVHRVPQIVHNLAGSRTRPRYGPQGHCDAPLICGLSRAEDCDFRDVHSGTMLQRRELRGLRAQCRNLPALPSVRLRQQAQ